MGRLFWKIFFGFWITLLLISAASGLLIWQHNRDRIAQLEVLVDSPRADMNISTTASILRYGGISAIKEVVEQRHRRHHRPFPIYIVNDKGQELLGRAVTELMLTKAHEALNRPHQSAIQQVFTPDGKRYMLFIPRHPLRKHGHYPLRHIPVMSLMIILLGSLLFSAVLAWYITKPIRFLRAATNRFADGRLETRVMPEMGRRRDEITELARDFDHMAAQVQQLIAVQKRLLNDVSHELRSPLARLQVAIEMGRQQPEKHMELMQRVEKESQRLNELVGNLLTLSKLESAINNEYDLFDISGLIQAVADDARFEAKKQNKQVQYNPSGEVLIQGNMELIHRAVENVVRNATFYTPSAGLVTISLSQNDSHITISVCDTGKGVTEENLTQLFLPFVRIDDLEQNTKVPGYGLGLAIARRAIEIHQGTIGAHNRPDGGLCITICLPV